MKPGTSARDDPSDDDYTGPSPGLTLSEPKEILVLQDGTVEDVTRTITVEPLVPSYDADTNSGHAVGVSLELRSVTDKATRKESIQKLQVSVLKLPLAGRRNVRTAFGATRPRRH